MQILTTISDFRSMREKIRSSGSLGLVPTMGYLHDGHLELVRHARVANETVAVSVFVNPTQFGPDEDVLTYPRDVERDQVLLEEVGCDLLFYPAVEEMYPPGGADIHVVPGKLAAVLEGASRPGHFRGVATVVAKLFNVVQPERAYFGQKDGQQLAVIRRMVRDLDFPVEIVARAHSTRAGWVGHVQPQHLPESPRAVRGDRSLQVPDARTRTPLGGRARR